MPLPVSSLPTVATDFLHEDFHARLYEHYAAWQRETPIFRNPEGVVYLTRHADCATLLSDRRFRRRPPDGGANPFSSELAEPNPFEVMINHWMFFMDPPRHTLVRQAFSSPFLPRAIDPLEAGIRSIARKLIDDIPRNAETDLISAFAYPLPILVICRILGIPAEDHSRFREWSAQLSRVLDAGSEQDMRDGVAASLAIRDYLTGLIGARVHGGPDDLLGKLIASAGANELTMDEVVYGCAFLIWSGHETTKSLIANGILALNEHPAQKERLTRRPQLMEPALEELLRYTSPVQKTSRWCDEDIAIGGFDLPRGTLVSALLGAANRDLAIFDDPGKLDIERSPNPHLAFSKGIHHCLGATLARLESRIALGMLLAEFPALSVIDYRWRANSSLRSLDYLTVAPC